MDEPLYWIYRTHVFGWRGQLVQARLVEPPPAKLRPVYGPAGFRDPQQLDPYGAGLLLTYQVDPRLPNPDNYFEDAGFELYSERLVALMEAFGVRAETFPVRCVDQEWNLLAHGAYAVYHLLEGVLPALDEEKSGWTGKTDSEALRLVLDPRKFEHRPAFYCSRVCAPLMRADLKQAIEQAGLTGFDFYPLDRYPNEWNGQE